MVSIVNASPTLGSVRQMPAMQNQGSPFLVNSHLSFNFLVGSSGLVNSYTPICALISLSVPRDFQARDEFFQ